MKIEINENTVKIIPFDAFMKLCRKVHNLPNRTRNKWRKITQPEMVRRFYVDSSDQYEVSCPPHPTTLEELAQ